MKLGLTVGKWALILVIWIFILLTMNDGIDVLTMIQFSLGLCYTAVAAAVGFWLFNTAENPKSAMSFIIRYALLAVLLFVCYAVSSDSIDEETGLVIEGSKLTEGGIYGLYTVTIIAVLAIVASEIKKMLK